MNTLSQNNGTQMLCTRQQPQQTMGMAHSPMGNQQHRKTMSYNDVHAQQRPVLAPSHQHHNRLPSYDTRNSNYYAFRHQQQQQLQQPLETTPNQHNRPYVGTNTAAAHSYHNHGKRPSLVGFDPMSSSAAAAAPSPMGRDSSPTVGDISRGAMERQSVTPPSSGRPLVAANLDNHDEDSSHHRMTNFEVFTNEKTKNGGKNPVAKHVNKFLRKAISVKHLSLGQHNSNSPKSSGKGKKNKNGATEANATAPPAPSPPMPLSPVATRPLITATPQAPAGAQTEESKSPSAETSMAQDLMEMKEQFGHLRIPSLSANIALPPTSFLTGTDTEAVTTSNEPTPFQLEIPSLGEAVITARLNEFVDNYRRYDQNLDLSRFIGLTRMQLQHLIDASASIHNHQKNVNHGTTLIREHVPIVQSLLDCAQNGGEISIQGFLQESGNLPADSRAEAVVFQGQRNFVVVFRGTTEQQQKVLGGSKSKKRAVPLDESKASANLEVYSGFLETYKKIETQCFKLVDKLVDENPFCDVTFSGNSFGAALATLAAYRYSTTRPMMRVGCLTLASPKVGFSHFRQVVHATPNLRVVRLELGNSAETKCQGPTVGGWHVGHTLVLNSSNSNNSNNSPTSSGSSSPTNNAESSLSFEKKHPSVSVYKFETPKHKNVGATALFKSSNPGLKKYISILEDLATVQNQRGTAATAKLSSNSMKTWPKDFANNSGKGVVVNNEKRLMV